jgi:hypothetical protein
MQRLTILVLFVAACGSDSNNQIDAPSHIDAPMGTLDCASYCTAIIANCTTANLQFGDMGTCMASCNDFPKGALADMGGDTLGCRLNHAMLAHSDPATHCVHAGPSGGGVCGTPCMGFCDITVAACPTAYANATACGTACAQFPATPAFTANVQSGNSASCRIYHATAASVTPDPHCMHVLPTGGPCQ